jgi:hypothetical protein
MNRLENYINKIAKEYIVFMGIKKLPRYQIKEIKYFVERGEKNGYDSLASYYYDVSTNAHLLKVYSNIWEPILHADWVLFHEFTHMLDNKNYVPKGEKITNIMYRGFSEYHAGQIDFMRLVRFTKLDDNFSFSMNEKVLDHTGVKKAEDLLTEAHTLATQIINTKPSITLELLSRILGMIFNYWGRRSICKMYAIDFTEKVNNSTIINFLGKEDFKSLDTLMNGWLDPIQIDWIFETYYTLLHKMVLKYSIK